MPPIIIVTKTEITDVDAGGIEELHHRLSANEGTLEVRALRGVLDHSIAAAISVIPATGYQINTDLQPHLELAPPAAVTAAPVHLEHWNRSKLALATELTAHESGTYAIHGTLHFAVCKGEQCFPKDEPIEIALDVR